jgi:hypothetical protein
MEFGFQRFRAEGNVFRRACPLVVLTDYSETKSVSVHYYVRPEKFLNNMLVIQKGISRVLLLEY